MRTWGGVFGWGVFLLLVYLTFAFKAYQYIARRPFGKAESEEGPGPMSPAVFTVTVSVPLVVFFSVVMNGIIGSKRDHDSRTAAARRDHLARLQPVLRSESERLLSLAGRLDADGCFVDPTKPSDSSGYQTLWPEGDPLLDDLPNHFAEFCKGRAGLKVSLPRHDRAYQELKGAVFRSLADLASLGPGFQDMAATEAFRRCIGKTAVLSIDEITTMDFTYTLRGSRGMRSALEALPANQAASRAFQSYSPGEEIRRACQSVGGEAARMSETAKQMSAMARGFSENATLPGDCPFVRID